MKNELTFLGHASMKLTTTDGLVIYLDPAFPGGDYRQAADLILISHHHGDHDKIDLVNKKPDCVVLDNNDFLQDGQYQKLNYRSVTIEGVSAYNKNHQAGESVGFLLWLESCSLYFSGDTSQTKEMAELAKYHLDYAILPIDGFYNMSPQEADDCISIIKPRIFIPVHNDPRSMKDGKEYDTNFALLKSPNVLRLKHGETIEL